MSLKPLVVRLRRHGRTLGTRELGATVAREIEEAARTADAVVVVDFDGVRIASSPFLDEVALAMRAAIAARGRYMLLANLNEDLADTMELVLERRGDALTLVEDQQLRLLGGRQHLQETLAEAQGLGTFSVSELAERLAVKLPNLHQRLTQLEQAGALRREDDPEAPRGRRLRLETAPIREVEAALGH